MNTKNYYRGKESLYHWADTFGLNSWEFDMLKRIARCRHKNNFIEDVEKTLDVLKIYLHEFNFESPRNKYLITNIEKFADEWELNRQEREIILTIINLRAEAWTYNSEILTQLLKEYIKF